MESVLQVKNLTVKIDGYEILNKITFDVHSGDTLAIIGPNGSGKTVLLKTILGLLPPTQGEILLKPDVRVGYVPQRINLDPYLRVTVNDLFFIKRKILNLPKKSVEHALTTIHLKEEILQKQLIHLSGGDLQRVLIVFAIIGEPDLLILDEPTANVDLPGEQKIHESLHHLQDLKNTTLILVSHDLNIVSKYANQILCLNKEMVCFGDRHDMLKPDILRKLYGDKMLYHHIHE